MGSMSAPWDARAAIIVKHLEAAFAELGEDDIRVCALDAGNMIGIAGANRSEARFVIPMSKKGPPNV